MKSKEETKIHKKHIGFCIDEKNDNVSSLFDKHIRKQ